MEIESTSSSSSPSGGVPMKKLNKSMLSKSDNKAHAINLLTTLGYLNNNWSTYETMAPIFEKLKPGLDRTPERNIKENCHDWNKYAKEESFGNIHKEGEDDDGCNITGIHRVCRRTNPSGDQEIRIHPEFASSVFENTIDSMDTIKALPIRNTKRVREGKTPVATSSNNTELTSEMSEMEKKAKSSIATQRKLLLRLEKRIREVNKIAEEYEQYQQELRDMGIKVQKYRDDLPAKTSRKRKTKPEIEEQQHNEKTEKKEKRQKKERKEKKEKKEKDRKHIDDIEDEMEKHERGELTEKPEVEESEDDVLEGVFEALEDEIEGESEENTRRQKAKKEKRVTGMIQANEQDSDGESSSGSSSSGSESDSEKEV